MRPYYLKRNYRKIRQYIAKIIGAKFKIQCPAASRMLKSQPAGHKLQVGKFILSAVQGVTANRIAAMS